MADGQEPVVFRKLSPGLSPPQGDRRTVMGFPASPEPLAKPSAAKPFPQPVPTHQVNPKRVDVIKDGVRINIHADKLQDALGMGWSVPVRMYKGKDSIDIPPAKANEAIAKGWSANAPIPETEKEYLRKGAPVPETSGMSQRQALLTGKFGKLEEERRTTERQSEAAGTPWWVLPVTHERIQDFWKDKVTQADQDYHTQLYRAYGPESKNLSEHERAVAENEASKFLLKKVGDQFLLGMTDPKTVAVSLLSTRWKALGFTWFGAQATKSSYDAIKQLAKEYKETGSVNPDTLENAGLSLGMMALIGAGTKEAVEDVRTGTTGQDVTALRRGTASMLENYRDRMYRRHLGTDKPAARAAGESVKSVRDISTLQSKETKLGRAGDRAFMQGDWRRAGRLWRAANDVGRRADAVAEGRFHRSIWRAMHEMPQSLTEGAVLTGVGVAAWNSVVQSLHDLLGTEHNFESFAVKAALLVGFRDAMKSMPSADIRAFFINKFVDLIKPKGQQGPWGGRGSTPGGGVRITVVPPSGGGPSPAGGLPSGRPAPQLMAPPAQLTEGSLEPPSADKVVTDAIKQAEQETAQALKEGQIGKSAGPKSATKAPTAPRPSGLGRSPLVGKPKGGGLGGQVGLSAEERRALDVKTFGERATPEQSAVDVQRNKAQQEMATEWLRQLASESIERQKAARRAGKGFKEPSSEGPESTTSIIKRDVPYTQRSQERMGEQLAKVSERATQVMVREAKLRVMGEAYRDEFNKLMDRVRGMGSRTSLPDTVVNSMRQQAKAIADKYNRIVKYHTRAANELLRLREKDIKRLAAALNDPHVGREWQLKVSGRTVQFVSDHLLGMIEEYMKPGIGKTTYSIPGVTLNKAAIGQAIDHIIMTKLTEPGAVEAVQFLTEALRHTGDKGLVLISNNGKGLRVFVDTLREELFHSWQTQLGGGSINRHLTPQQGVELYVSMPKEMMSYLEAMQYNPRTEIKGAVWEATCKLATQEHPQVSVADRTAYLKKYFEYVLQNHGAKALLDMQHVKKSTVDIRDEILHQYRSLGPSSIQGGSASGAAGQGQP